MNVTIKVTTCHIVAGWRGSTCNCPIALAIKDHVKPDLSVIVRYTFAYFTEPDHKNYGSGLRSHCGAPSVKLPDEAMQFIIQFDQGSHPLPFEFQLEIPTHFLKDAHD